MTLVIIAQKQHHVSAYKALRTLCDRPTNTKRASDPYEKIRSDYALCRTCEMIRLGLTMRGTPR